MAANDSGQDIQAERALAAARTGGWRSGPLACAALALVGGAITWGLLQGVSPFFQIPEKYHVTGLGAPPEKWIPFEAERAKAARRNAMLEFASFGALVAGMMGLGEGLARRRLRLVLVAVPVAAAVGCLAGLAGKSAYEAFGAGPQADLAGTLKVQAIALGLLGLGVGLALGLAGNSLRDVVISSIAGTLAGALAGVLYPVAISLLMPAASTDSLVPKAAASRMLWVGLFAALSGLIVAATAGQGRPTQQPGT